MTPTRDRINVDHEEIKQKTSQMTAVLDDLMNLRNGLEKIIDDMVREASFATTSGGPSPVFHPLINASSSAVTRLQKSLDAVHYRIQKDLEILNTMSDHVEKQSEDAAVGIDSSDQDFARGSGGTSGSTSTSGGTGGSGGTAGGSGESSGSGGSGSGESGGSQGATPANEPKTPGTTPQGFQNA